MGLWFLRGLSTGAFLLLWGCATPSTNDPSNKTRSDALLAQQIQPARALVPQSDAPRLMFAGVAMDDRSQAFRHDVLLAEKVVRAIDTQAVVLRLVNPVPGQAADLPYATPAHIAQVLQTLATLAWPQDKVVVVLTSHGAPGFLSVHAGMKPQNIVSSIDLQRQLALLQERPTLLVVSACFSGSLIAPLAHKQRIILTAAAVNRASFGCDSKSDNTYFVKSLFKQPKLPEQSIRSAMQEAMVGVSALEKEMELTPPSMPQASYGSAVQNWARQPIGKWLQAAETADAPEGFKATPLNFSRLYVTNINYTGFLTNNLTAHTMSQRLIRNLVLGAALAASSALASAAIQQHTFSITGNNGETGSGRFTWDDAAISSGPLNGSSSSLDAKLLSINITISGGNVNGGTTSFTRANCSGAYLYDVPSFTDDINFWCDNGTNSLVGVEQFTNIMNGEGSTLTFAPAAIAAQSVPTLSQWGMLMLASLMAMGGFVALRRRS